MNLRRKLPIGVQSFQALREEGYLYVDKTEYIFDLVHGGRQYFLSRPRRFGKSLLLSTMRAYWEGKKDLFRGLAIEKLEEERVAAEGEEAWRPYPVFNFDFNRDDFTVEGGLEEILDAHLQVWEEEYGCEGQDGSLAVRFQNLLVIAHRQTGLRCVVLVDEYDKPLLEVLHKDDLEEHNKAVFKGFFSTLKSYDEHLQFAFLTGVTKFSKVSIFSDLNQLNDISMDRKYAGICGITEEELQGEFGPEIAELAAAQGVTAEECASQLKKQYDGYHFHQNGVAVYNPFSLLNAFARNEFGEYWFATGTPTFLVRRIRNLQMDARKLEEGKLYASGRELSDYRADNPNPLPLLYQTGYLTIAGYDARRQRYTLGFPNDEVRYGFLESLLPEYTQGVSAQTGKDIFSIDDYIEEGDPESVMKAFEALFASIPYTTDEQSCEHYFQSVIFLVFTLLGRYVQAEVHSSAGRADCIVETPEFVYVFEFKRDGSAEEALRQIEERDYTKPYAADSRTVYRIGASFDSERRVLEDWKIEAG